MNKAVCLKVIETLVGKKTKWRMFFRDIPVWISVKLCNDNRLAVLQPKTTNLRSAQTQIFSLDKTLRSITSQVLFIQSAIGLQQFHTLHTLSNSYDWESVKSLNLLHLVLSWSSSWHFFLTSSFWQSWKLSQPVVSTVLLYSFYDLWEHEIGGRTEREWEW